MNTSDENTLILEDLITEDDFIISDELVKFCYEQLKPNNKIQYVKSKRKRDELYSRQYEYMRRNLLKLKYKRNNNSAYNIKEGFVYAIYNPSFPDFIKVGSAIDVYDRLNSYQTSSPFRDYELLIYFFSDDRRKTEREIHNMFERNAEWCKVEKEHILDVFRIYRKFNSIK